MTILCLLFKESLEAFDGLCDVDKDIAISIVTNASEYDTLEEVYGIIDKCGTTPINKQALANGLMKFRERLKECI